METLFTIIIPHFNLPLSLRRLLNSIPPRDDLEVLVVDDCSTKQLDELHKVKDEFKNVRWLSTNENGGGGKARNVGLENARGKYLIFADADDFFLPEFNPLLDKIKSSGLDFDLLFFNSNSVYEESLLKADRTKRVNDSFKRYKVNPEKSKALLQYTYGEPWGKIVKAELVRKNNIRFDETPIHNDTRFSYLVGFHARNILVEDITAYCVTDRLNSISKNINWDNLLVKAQVFSKKAAFLKENKITTTDPITFTPFLIAALKGKTDGISKFYRIYKDNGLSSSQIMSGIIKSTVFYIKNDFVGKLSRYLSLPS